MNKVAIIPLVMGVVIGGIAIKLGLNAVQEAKGSTQHEMVTAVVALADIDATAAIEKAMLTTVNTPKTPLLGDHSFSKMEDVVGRVAAMSIPRGAAVREDLLAPKGTTPGLAVRIEPGFRAVSVKIDEVTGVAYQVLPGAFVDVIAVMSVSKGRKQETVCRTILQNVKVGAVGRTLSTSGEDDAKGKVAKSVTLLVRESDAPLLHLAQTRGKLTLSLRSGDDDMQTDAANATEKELLAGFTDDSREDAKTSHKQNDETAQDPRHQVMVVHAGLAQRFELVNGGAARVVTVRSKPSAAAEDDEQSDGADGPMNESDPDDLAREKQKRPVRPG